jgi:hypothetical protein
MPFAKDCIIERYSSKIFYRLPQYSSLLLHRGRRLPHLIPEIPPSRGTEGIPHADLPDIELMASRQPDLLTSCMPNRTLTSSASDATVQAAPEVNSRSTIAAFLSAVKPSTFDQSRPTGEPEVA